LTGPTDRFTIEPSVANNFAWIRTRLGIERTFMAWIRTGISLIGFGFTIVQFFQRLQGTAGANGKTMRPEAPRELGLTLIGTGILALGIAIYQYRGSLHYLWLPQFSAIAGFSEHQHRTPAMAVAIVLVLTGIFAFVSVFFHIM
jgi:putative membrane protein